MTGSAHDNVARVLEKLNQAWIRRRFDEMQAFLHPDVMLATPGFGERVRGSGAYIAGHRDFMEKAMIHEFVESTADVDIVADVAVVNYRYEMDYERSGKRYVSSGRDLYVLRRTGDGWLVVWRTILEVDERAAA